LFLLVSSCFFFLFLLLVSSFFFIFSSFIANVFQVAELVYYSNSSNVYNKSREAMGFFGLCMHYRNNHAESLHYLSASLSPVTKQWIRQPHNMKHVMRGLFIAALGEVRTNIVLFGDEKLSSKQITQLVDIDSNHPELPVHLRRDAMVRQGTWCRVVSKKGIGSTGDKARDAFSAAAGGSSSRKMLPRCGTANCVVGSKLYMFGGIEMHKSNPVGTHLPLLHQLFEARICSNAHKAGLQMPTNELMIYDMKTGIWDCVRPPKLVVQEENKEEKEEKENEGEEQEVGAGKKKRKKKKKQTKKRKKKGSSSHSTTADPSDPSIPWPAARGMACLAFGGEQDNGLYLCGGRTLWHYTSGLEGQNFLRDVWRFDLDTRTWEEFCETGPPLSSTCAHCIVGGVWFLVDPMANFPSRKPKTAVRCLDLDRRAWSTVADKRIKYTPDAKPHVSDVFHAKVIVPIFVLRNSPTQISGWHDDARDMLCVWGASAPSLDMNGRNSNDTNPDVGQCGIWVLSGLRRTAEILKSSPSSSVSRSNKHGKKLTWRNYLFRTTKNGKDHMRGTMPWPVSESSCCFDPVTRKAYAFGGWNPDVYTMACGKRGQYCQNSGKYYNTLHEIDMDNRMIRTVENYGATPTATVLGPGRRGYATMGAWTPKKKMEEKMEETEGDDGDDEDTVLVCAFGYTSYDTDKGQFSSLTGQRDAWTCDIKRKYVAEEEEEEEEDPDLTNHNEQEEEDDVQTLQTPPPLPTSSSPSSSSSMRDKAMRRLMKRVKDDGFGVKQINLSSIQQQYHQAFVGQQGASETLVYRKRLTLLTPPSRGRGCYVLNILPQNLDGFDAEELDRAKVDGANRFSDEDFWAKKNIQEHWHTQAQLETRFPDWKKWSKKDADMYYQRYNHEQHVFVVFVLQDRQRTLDQYRQDPPKGMS
jgi:hypothetical protein